MTRDLMASGRAALGDPAAMLEFADAIARSQSATEEQRAAAGFARNSLRTLMRRTDPSEAVLSAALIRFSKLLKVLEAEAKLHP